MTVRFAPRARADVEGIRLYVAERNPRAADRIVERILMAVSRLEHSPALGRLGRVDGTRELVVPGPEYVVIYTEATDGDVDVERVLHGARKHP